MTEKADQDNADQKEFWSGASGDSWTAHQDAMDRILKPVLDLILDRAALKPGDRVIDIGCGTGASVLAAAQAVGPEGHVAGYDISPSLLQTAALRTANLANVSLTEADAQSAAFASGRADAVISRFGVMFFANPTAAFANIASALRPGGKMTLAAWGPAPQNPWFMDPAKVASAILGPVEKFDRTLPGPFAFEDADRVRALLTLPNHSLRITAEPIRLGTLDTLDDLAALSLAIGPAVRVMREKGATDDDRARIFDGIRALFERYDGAVPAVINLIEITKDTSRAIPIDAP